MKNKTQPNK